MVDFRRFEYLNPHALQSLQPLSFTVAAKRDPYVLGPSGPRLHSGVSVVPHCLHLPAINTRVFRRPRVLRFCLEESQILSMESIDQRKQGVLPVRNHRWYIAAVPMIY